MTDFISKFTKTCLLIASFFAVLTTAAADGVTQGQQIGAQSAQSARHDGGVAGDPRASETANDILAEPDVDTTGSPANGGDSGADTSATFNGNLLCVPNSAAFVGGVGVKTIACHGSETQVTSVDYQICTAGKHGESCDGNWSQTYNVADKNSRVTGNTTVSIDCAPGQMSSCRLAVHYKESFVHGEDSISENASNQADSEDNGLQGMLNDTQNDIFYRESLKSVGPQFSDCIKDVNYALDGGGLIYTCDGNQSVDMGRECQTVTECLEYRTGGLEWGSECISDVRLVNQSCDADVPQGTCESELEKGNYTCNNELELRGQPCDITHDSQIETCSRKLGITVEKLPGAGCTPGQLLAYGTRSNYWSHITNKYWVYCASNGYRVLHREDSKYGNKVIYDRTHSVAPLGSFSGVQSGNRSNNYATNFKWYYSHSCSGNSCTFTSYVTCSPSYNNSYCKAIKGKQAYKKILNYTHPSVDEYRIEETWEDGCTAYQ